MSSDWKPFVIHQDIFKQSHPSILVIPAHESSTKEARVALDYFMQSVTTTAVGVAAAYTRCTLAAIAFATDERVYLVKFSTSRKQAKRPKEPAHHPARQALNDTLLCQPELRKIGFNLDRLVTSLYLDVDLRMKGGVDLYALTGQKKTGYGSLASVMQGLGGLDILTSRDRVSAVFKNEEFDMKNMADLAIRAWASFRAGAAEASVKSLESVSIYDTEILSDNEIALLSKWRRDQDRLDALKPTITKNEVAAEFSFKKGNLHLQSSRYKTRVQRMSGDQHIRIDTQAKEGGKKGKKDPILGHAVSVKGRAAKVSMKAAISTDVKITAVYTIGKEAPTTAEETRADLVRGALQRTNALLQRPFVEAIWRPYGAPASQPTDASSSRKLEIAFDQRPLNPSQKKAVTAILDESPSKKVVVIHGGPGTGKTTVISAAVINLMADLNRGRSVWLVAQSNVAVKNIAEKLAELDFLDFKLIVSQDFHFDWHEHLYERIERNVIRSDTLDSHYVGVSRQIGGARVILCTLSMLANGRLRECGLTRIVPVETVFVDEASQIEAGDYLPMFHIFASSLKKLICIGDDKQLPPYGQEDIPELKSIFEIPHLRKGEIFLDTQYRMPLPIGTFISRHVYTNRLKSVHQIKDLSCCRFVDIAHGAETSSGHSWINLKEVEAIVHIARRYQNQGKSYRIITPYDPQRGRLEEALKNAKLAWEDKCFNVDSFQGNEDDHIIVSVVRTAKVGFLKNQRRTNVMLSRCKKSMTIVSNRNFLTGNATAKKTLVGKMAATWAGQPWITWQDVLNGRF